MPSLKFWIIFLASQIWVSLALVVLAAALVALGVRAFWRGRQLSAGTPGKVRVWPAVMIMLGLVPLVAVVVAVEQYPQFFLQLFAADFANDAELATARNANLTTKEQLAAEVGAWPQWRGPRRDGVSTETGLRADWTATPPTVVWKKPIGKGYSSVAVDHGRLYTMDRQGEQERLLCLDAATGETLWSCGYVTDFGVIQAGEGKGLGPRATPTVQDGRVYAVGATGRVLCLEATPATATAKVLWEHDLAVEYDLVSGLKPRMPEWGIACSPLVEGGLVIVQPGGPDAAIVAFDCATGQLRWHSQNDYIGYSSPVAATAAGQRQLIAMTGERALGLRPTDGQLLWAYDFQTKFHGNIATPIVAGDYVFISADYDKGCALLHLVAEGTGVRAEPVYFKANKLMRNHHASSVLLDGYLYGFDGNNLKCVDLRSGVEKWNARQAVDKGSLLAAEGRLVILTQNGLLVLVEATPDAFRKKGQLQVLEDSGTDWAAPALADGRLYIRDAVNIMCLDLRK